MGVFSPQQCQVIEKKLYTLSKEDKITQKNKVALLSNTAKPKRVSVISAHD